MGELTYSGWWFGTWMLFSISYMGCHPGIIPTPFTNSYFSRWLLHHQPVLTKWDEPPSEVYKNWGYWGYRVFIRGRHLIKYILYKSKWLIFKGNPSLPLVVYWSTPFYPTCKYTNLAMDHKEPNLISPWQCILKLDQTQLETHWILWRSGP